MSSPYGKNVPDYGDKWRRQQDEYLRRMQEFLSRRPVDKHGPIYTNEVTCFIQQGVSVFIRDGKIITDRAANA